MGFKVTPIVNPKDANELLDGVDAWAETLKRGDTAVFYFAGHGWEFAANAREASTNYLLSNEVDGDTDPGDLALLAINMNKLQAENRASD